MADRNDCSNLNLEKKSTETKSTKANPSKVLAKKIIDGAVAYIPKKMGDAGTA